ncbi:ABC transporter ATP-binding protein [Cupriavidus basilensis]|uniref:ABC transporter ATP-binding protein n=1 Tax=Cupriavidus basilensis TaxID=68895 RepID=A0ABT6APZ4_9BURK|nr:ABC transporter ATP-binding protein [Cupriavidus basilensis]MDF3834647.1 ABC transporter ATP-binding protein [Cupriavidus basilensis]
MKLLPISNYDLFEHCKFEVFSCLALTVILTLISLVPALTVGSILDKVIHTRAYATLTAIILLFLLFHACEIIFTFIFDKLMLYVTDSAVEFAERDFISQLSKASLLSLEAFRDRDGLSRFTSIGVSVRFRADWIVGVTSIPLNLLIIFTSLYLVSITLAMLILVLSIIFVLIHTTFNRLQRRAAIALQTSRDREQRVVNDIFDGLPSLCAHLGFNLLIARWESRKCEFQEALDQYSSVSLIQNVAGLSYERITLAVILSVGAYETLQGRMSVGQLVMANLLFRQVAIQVRQITPLLQRRVQFQASQAAFDTFIGRLLPALSPRQLSVADPGFALQVKNVSFTSEDHIPILSDITFNLPARATLGVIGESGAGKSTLLKTLAGLYTPKTGTVFVGDEMLARRVYLSQKEHLFDGSVEENIQLGKTEDNDAFRDLLAALELVQLCHRDAQVREQSGEYGRTHELSGGERQRIFLARVLVGPFSAVFFDEPTTALDERRRKEVVQRITALARHSLVVFSTHDEDLARAADYVLHLKRGRVAKFGKGADVLGAKQDLAVDSQCEARDSVR